MCQVHSVITAHWDLGPPGIPKWSEVAQSCPTLCDPVDCNPPDSSVHGILQARTMGFSRQEYWSGLPFPPPGDLPDPGIEPATPASQADAFTSEPPGKSWASQSPPFTAASPAHPQPVPLISIHQTCFVFYWLCWLQLIPDNTLYIHVFLVALPHQKVGRTLPYSLLISST